MKKIYLLLFALISVMGLIGCHSRLLEDLGVESRPSKGSVQGIVQGQSVVKTCGGAVPIGMTQPLCSAETPYSTELSIYKIENASTPENQQLLTKITTDTLGNFSMNLAEGNYLISGPPTTPSLIQSTPSVNFTVEVGKTTQVKITTTVLMD